MFKESNNSFWRCADLPGNLTVGTSNPLVFTDEDGPGLEGPIFPLVQGQRPIFTQNPWDRTQMGIGTHLPNAWTETEFQSAERNKSEIFSQTSCYENKVDCSSAITRHLKWKDLEKAYMVVEVAVVMIQY